MTERRQTPPESTDQRRQPKQSRSVETRNSLLEAAGVLFAAQGYDKTTTHQIAAKAEVSVGALYRYFADKEAILKEVYRQEMATLRDRILEEFSPIDLDGLDARSAVREALRRAFTIFAERPQLRQVLGEQSRKVSELVEMRRAQEEELYGTVGRILASVPTVHLPDVETGGYLIALFCNSVIEDYLLYRRNHGARDDERVLEAAADFVVSYLRLHEPGSPASKPPSSPPAAK